MRDPKENSLQIIIIKAIDTHSSLTDLDDGIKTGFYKKIRDDT